MSLLLRRSSTVTLAHSILLAARSSSLGKRAFQIKQGDKIIAATNTARIEDVWDGQGWTEKLHTALKAASTKFIGPLTSPREPWHYTYNP